MELMKLKDHRYAQCRYYHTMYLAGKQGWGHEWGFMSYTTRVIIVRGSRVMFTGYYSRTTSKQMTWWLKEFGDRLKGLTHDTLKIMDEEGMAYDYETGELTPLTDYEERERKEVRRSAFHYGYEW
jgi:hypothetical protein